MRMGKTYQERCKELTETGIYDFTLSLNVYLAHVEKNGAVKAKNENAHFLEDGGAFDTFLAMEAQEDVFVRGLEMLHNRRKETELGDTLIIRGEDLIREGYRLRDNASFLTHYDYMAHVPRHHAVILAGIHDHDDKGGDAKHNREVNRVRDAVEVAIGRITEQHKTAEAKYLLRIAEKDEEIAALRKALSDAVKVTCRQIEYTSEHPDCVHCGFAKMCIVKGWREMLEKGKTDTEKDMANTKNKEGGK